MAKRLRKEEKKELAVIEIINKMFEIAGHNVTYEDIKDRKDNWWTDWTITVAQNDEWKEWGKQYLKKNFKLRDKYAETEMSMFSVMWGLKFSDFELTE
jgi:hypothetical protein